MNFDDIGEIGHWAYWAKMVCMVINSYNYLSYSSTEVVVDRKTDQYLSSNDVCITILE